MSVKRKLFESTHFYDSSIDYYRDEYSNCNREFEIIDTSKTKVDSMRYMFKTALKIKDIKLIELFHKEDIIPKNEAVNITVESGWIEVLDFLYLHKDVYPFDQISSYLASEKGNLNVVKKLHSFGIKPPTIIPYNCFHNYFRNDISELEKQGIKDTIVYLITQGSTSIFHKYNPKFNELYTLCIQSLHI
jgi:hypothetical protein